MEKFPTIQHLASAQIKEVERVITPLGLERKRAELLKKLAKQLIERYKGRVPSDREELMQLPCIGRYTANAILCFAFGLSVPLVDTNVARVINRIFSVPYSTTSRTHIQNMWKFMERIVPRKEAKEFNLAIIDFANMICRSKNPKHEYCIVKDICNWYFNHLKHKTEVGSSSLGI
jgi:A/G-specific adenine glycosylase